MMASWRFIYHGQQGGILQNDPVDMGDLKFVNYKRNNSKQANINVSVIYLNSLKLPHKSEYVKRCCGINKVLQVVIRGPATKKEVDLVPESGL
jgi:hypothetical protein